MKVWKYKLSAYFSSHTQQMLAPSPFEGTGIVDHPHQLIGGAQGRFMSLYLRQSSFTERMEFLTSILLLKKGLPRPEKKDIEESIEEYLARMTKESEPEERKPEWLVPWSDVELLHPITDIVASKATCIKQLQRTVDEICKEAGEGILTTKERTKAFFPSTSANYISSRSNGGSVGELLTNPEILEGLRRPGGYLTAKTKGEEEIENEDQVTVEFIDTKEFEKAFETLWLRVLKTASTEEALATPVGLAEPLKIRTITKGPPYISMVLRALWKKIFTILSKNKAFDLLWNGGVTEEYLLNRFGAKLGENEVFISGDFREATDNIKSWASEAVANRYSSQLKLHPVENRLFLKSLTGHTFVPPDPKKWEQVSMAEWNEFFKQKRGQLMGSITSFPILCTINACACRWAMELASKKKILLRDAKLAINGDDSAMVSTEECYRIWKVITRTFGLYESPGKTFIDKRFVNINSTNFVYAPSLKVEDRPEPKHLWSKREDGTWHKRDSPYYLTKYINMGLLRNLKRAEGLSHLNDESDPRNNVGVRYRKLMSLCPDLCKEYVHKEFIEGHKFLNGFKIPWYIPEWLGGFGLTGYKHPSKLDRKIAWAILNNWEIRRPIQIAHGQTTWKNWQMAQRQMPEPLYTDHKGNGTEIFTRMMGLKVIDLLFDSNIRYKDLYNTHEEESRMVFLQFRHNEKLWSPKSYKEIPGDPMPESKLLFRPKYSTYKLPLLLTTTSILD